MKRPSPPMRTPNSHWLRIAVSFAMATLVGYALGHATVVFGTLSVDPNPPTAGIPFGFELTLDDPAGTPVEDAVVIAELTPADSEEPLAEIDPEAEPRVVVRFAETEPGTYRAETTVPIDGPYRVFLRDQTFAQEEATQILSMPVGTGTPIEPIDFLFPPTATGGNLSTWLLWLVAIPLAAGIVVTILVLRAGPQRSATANGADDPEPVSDRPIDRH